MFSSEIGKRIAKIDRNSISLYLNFLGYDSFFVSGSDEISASIRKAISTEFQNEEDMFHKVLTISEKGSESSISVSQFLYDIEVFFGIYSEVKNRITFSNFCAFFKQINKRCEKSGWKIIFAQNNFITKKLERSGIEIEYINENECDSKVILIINGNLDISFYYEKYKAEKRIAKHFFLELIREWIIIETCNFFKERLAEKGVLLYLGNWEWAQNNVLFPKDAPTSYDIDQRKWASIYNIAGNEDNYSDFLHQLYGDYSEEYIKNIFDVPSKLDLAKGKIRHADKNSRYLNVISGERFTPNQPKNYNNTIYMLGGCVFFGYAIDDSNTIAAHLQNNLNNKCKEKKWRVCNYGTWGGNIDQTYATLFDLNYKHGDIVLVSYAGLLPIGDFDISNGMSKVNTDREFYYDGVFHCNSEGYRCVAENIYSLLKEEFNNEIENEQCFILENADEQEMDFLLKKYIEEVKLIIPADLTASEKIGAIVMNCNPFTLGHRYLIEYACKTVDALIIFVVEEDRSFFPFEDRIKLVKAGVADLKNVVVVPSGVFIISTVTFPGYFMKDNPENAILDSSQDVEVFARKIAPSFNITVRFVGEEPLDIVTNQYNETLKTILPRYDIELIEIPRKNSGSQVISASRVRALLKNNDFNAIAQLVPESTLQYLRERFG